MFLFLRQMLTDFRQASRKWGAVRAKSGHPVDLADLPDEMTGKINQASRAYYNDPSKLAYWLGKPYCDTTSGSWWLYRFALLACGLKIYPGCRILDFGCGTGWTCELLARQGAQVTGVDIAPQALEIAHQRMLRSLAPEVNERTNFVAYSGKRLPFEDGEFDTVLAFDALHHLPNPRTLIKELSRVLWTHGLFGFAEPGVAHADDQTSREEAETGILEQDVHLESLYRAAIAAGFHDLDLLLAGPHPDTFSLPMNRARWYLRGCSWVIPADVLRHSIVTGPIGIFKKGPYPISSLNPSALKAEIKAPQDSIRARSGEQICLQATVTNQGNTVWLASGHRGRGFVRLGAHLLEGGRMVEQDYGRAALPADVLPEQSICLELRLQTPSQPGRYTIVLDMVDEGLCWFSERGSRRVSLSVEAIR